MKRRIDGLTDSQKAEILDSIFSMEYEALLKIDCSTSLSTTLHGSGPFWGKAPDTALPYEDLLRRRVLDTSVDTDPESVLTEMSLPVVLKNLESSSKHTVYYTVRKDDGRLGFMRGLFFRGANDCVMLAIQDISDAFRSVNSKIEALTQALSDAKEEISQKEAFLSLMDQHLRTPLYSIMGLTHITEEHPSPHAFDDYLHKVSMSGSYMQETIDDMLTLRQIARHQIVLEPVTIDLTDFFQNIERMIHPSISGRGLLFEMDIAAVSSLQIIADIRCLQQIVMKMLRSAIEYTVKGGRIRLLARVLYQNNENVCLGLSVENRGIIIDPDRLNLLFKPYDYLGEQLNHDIKDLDITLFILRSNLLAMGSDSITVESDDVKGTRISVSLSVPAQNRTGASFAQDHGSQDFYGKRVLLVDDNEISLDVSEKLLVSRGISVVKAHNGKEALEEFRRDEGGFDLILMDVLMPGLDGLEATRRIRAMEDIPGAGTIPIIALTVSALPKNVEDSLKAGMNAHLVKPIEPDMLYQVLDDYLAGK